MKELPLEQVSGLLGAGPVILVSTADGTKRDVMTLAWYTVLDFNPPRVGIVMGSDHYSRELLDRSRSCVIAVPGVDLAPAVVGAGSASGRDVDKFLKFKIATATASKVVAPLLADCLANFECKLVDDSIGKYELVVLEVVKAWINPERKEQRTLHHCGKASFYASGEKIDLAPLFPRE
jgi:flavin reductase (DIM6/NTAB) family NADH-FMN oxidoreductase RutF